MLNKKISSFLVFLFIISVFTFFSGCEEQPVGYIFSPTQRENTSIAQGVADVVNSIYAHTDKAVDYLARASLTDDYGSLLLGGWESFPAKDSLTGEDYTLYRRIYLDQDYYFLRFDRIPMAGSIRTPSSLDYGSAQLRSYQDLRTSEYFGDVSESRNALIEYSNDRQDDKNVDGWFDIRTLVQIEEEIEIAGGGTVIIENNIPINWNIRIVNYSIDLYDYKSKLTIVGRMNIRDEAGQFHTVQVTSEIIMEDDGRGQGDITLYGENAARIHFTNKTSGFNGYFTLFEDNHDQRFMID